ncbi:hypothetical protein L1987_60505 [Smallanthus sonchifolius]|uniref:Uncharacterized protein n=1 Tax=Smallanthus sonchifolius TaxID=185202 RepID=A0ACB9D869_9ASTR|nr:hypothetical protein L1987_60505 [Smallanthus sonchifolius]
MLNCEHDYSFQDFFEEFFSGQKQQLSILEEAVNVYTSELERFLNFIGEVFANSPFFVTAEEAGAIEANKNDDYREASVHAGRTYEVSLEVDSVNSYIAWDFSIAQGKISMDIGFSIEYTDSLGRKTGNFCTILAGNYKLIWDNSFSTFFRKALRYKVDCIPPVVEPEGELGTM